MNAVTEALLDQISSGLSNQQPLDRAMRRVGEDMIIEQIYDIFDEVARETEEVDRRQRPQ